MRQVFVYTAAWIALLDELKQAHPGLQASMWSRWPIRRRDQRIFAEAFGQGLAEGFGIEGAFSLASQVVPNPRFRRALSTMWERVRAGHPLATSLEEAGIKVDLGLIAALQVGEEYGGLEGELFAFSRGHPHAIDRFRRAVGRSPEATKFAAALARRLRDQGLSVRLVRAAGQIASAHHRGFARVVDAIVGDMENGVNFVEALRSHPKHFDLLYHRFLDHANSTDEMRACLERLGRTEWSP